MEFRLLCCFYAFSGKVRGLDSLCPWDFGKVVGMKSEFGMKKGERSVGERETASPGQPGLNIESGAGGTPAVRPARRGRYRVGKGVGAT